MRDPNRIKPILERLEKQWLKVPDWRLGQLISNVIGGADTFYIEDENLIDGIENYFKGR